MRQHLVVFTLLVSFVAAGCTQAPMTKSQKGALWGTGIGAATGAALGQAIGRNTESTLIGMGAGAIAGAIAGGAIGSYMDRQEQELRQALAGSEAASIQRDKNVLALTFKSDVLFDINSATLKPGAYQELDRVARVLNKYPDTKITVQGHTDSTGSESYNLELSKRRAEAVKNALVSRGVDPARIQTIGYGESMPIASNDTEAGRQLNRRVTIIITPVQG